MTTMKRGEHFLAVCKTTNVVYAAIAETRAEARTLVIELMEAS